MNRVFSLSVLSLCLLCTLFSCTNADFDSVFDGKNEEALMPLDISSVCQEPLVEALSDRSVIGSIASRACAGRFLSKMAYVINDSAILDGVVDSKGNEAEFDESLFDNYSLVVCTVSSGSGSHFNEQRVLVNKQSVTIYVDFYSSFYQDARLFHSLHIYPKLPDGPVELIVRKRYADGTVITE